MVYEVKLWATGKVLVGAIIDAANTAFGAKEVKFGGESVKFGWGKDCGELGPEATVTSYVLGDFGDQDLLKFERSDEIEDVDGFDENQDNLQFIIYNAAEETKPACDLNNFWADAAMLKKYRCNADNTHANIGERVKPANVIEYLVSDWPALMAAHVNKTDSD